MSNAFSSATPPARLVLIADDDPTIRQLLKIALAYHGLTALCVGDGAAAVASVEAHGTTLLAAILDNAMPHMTGVVAAAHIRRIAPQLPIIILSAHLEAAHRTTLRALSVAAIIDKPFAPDHLLGVLQEAIDAPRATERAAGA